MVVRKPYKFLIKNFKKIHIFISLLLMYICFESNNILNYFNKLIDGTGIRLESLSYINNFIVFLIVLAIVGFIIIYILMRYKKKPKKLYLITILGYIGVIIILLVSYSYLREIRTEYIEQKTIRLYRDFIQIGIYYQYVIIVIMLLRGLGLNLKKFDFDKELKEFEIEDRDNEEVEINVDLDYNKIDRKINRTKRELKYYYLENKLFILIILGFVLLIGGFNLFKNLYVNNIQYSLDKEVKIGNYYFTVTDSYVSNVDFSNQVIDNNKNYVVVKFKIRSDLELGNYNIDNFSLKYKDEYYYANKVLCKKFYDIGNCYNKQDVTSVYNPYIVVFELDNNNVNNNLIFNVRNGAEDYNFKLKTNNNMSKEFKLNENIDFSNTILENNKYKITSYNLNNRFDYNYENCLSTGECNTFNSYVSSQVGLIMELNVESEILSGALNESVFIEYYGKLKYKIQDKEYTSTLNNKTSNKITNKVYLEVDKEINNADSIWFEFDIRGDKIKYILK